LSGSWVSGIGAGWRPAWVGALLQGQASGWGVSQGDPLPPGTRTVWRGRKRQPKAPDPAARHRWPVGRTNAWLHNWRRISTRWERRPELYFALLQLACSMIICRLLECSL
jgi:transposase